MAGRPRQADLGIEDHIPQALLKNMAGRPRQADLGIEDHIPQALLKNSDSSGVFEQMMVGLFTIICWPFAILALCLCSLGAWFFQIFQKLGSLSSKGQENIEGFEGFESLDDKS